MGTKFKVSTLIAVMLLMVSSCAKRGPVDIPPSWKLIWSDEFNAPAIDTNIWSYEQGGGGWGNNELEYYTSRTVNAYTENGSLVIQALAENYSGNSFTSARMITKGKMSMEYGKVEASIKAPCGQGIWPAFWMMGDNFTWPACGETDIMEMIGGGAGRDNVNYGTGHWDDNGHKSQGGSITPVVWPAKLSDDYHVYGIEWDANSIKWSVDGTVYFTLDITPAAMSEFHQPFFLLLNVAVGGSWPGSPDGTTIFPQKMYVDWVRWYEWK